MHQSLQSQTQQQETTNGKSNLTSHSFSDKQRSIHLLFFRRDRAIIGGFKYFRFYS